MLFSISKTEISLLVLGKSSSLLKTEITNIILQYTLCLFNLETVFISGFLGMKFPPLRVNTGWKYEVIIIYIMVKGFLLISLLVDT